MQSNTYYSTKSWISRVMEDPSCPQQNLYHLVMSALVFVSVGLVILEVKFSGDHFLAALFARMGDLLTVGTMDK
ncbi:MAG: hypothetical protein H7839_11995 [Magnetococcus sp. YQC-5]